MVSGTLVSRFGDIYMDEFVSMCEGVLGRREVEAQVRRWGRGR